MRYCVDIDGTICSQTVGRDYHKAMPWWDRIATINKLYDEGHNITYFTARGMVDSVMIQMQVQRHLFYYLILQNNNLKIGDANIIH